MTPDQLLEKYKDVLHKTFVDKLTKKEYTYKGIWVDEDDYHFLMYSEENGMVGLSCVGDFETHGFELVKEKSTNLKHCPFCGSQLEYDHPDCIYPHGKPEYNAETDELYYPLWQITCHIGNCGAILLGDSKEDCAHRWNMRYN